MLTLHYKLVNHANRIAKNVYKILLIVFNVKEIFYYIIKLASLNVLMDTHLMLAKIIFACNFLAKNLVKHAENTIKIVLLVLITVL